MKLKIGNIEQELKFMNKLYMENRFSEIVIRGQILNKKFPNIVPFYNILGLSYVKIGKDLLAAKIFENGLFHNQNELSLLTNLADTYRNLNKLKDSEELLKRAIHINEKDLYSLISYGRLRISQGKAEEAIDYFKRVYNIDKNFNDVILRIANAYLSIRNFKEAKKYFEMAVYETPLKIGADYSYSQMVDYSQDDKHQKHMLEKLKNKEIEKITKGPLYFAIAKSFNDQKKYDEAFKYFKLGNEDMNSRVKDKILKREKHDLEKLKYIFENFDFTKNINIQNIYSKKLIFILGLPRTGTTLIHQIISSHPKVRGVGESNVLHAYFLPNIKKENFINNIFQGNELNEKFISELSLSLGKNYDYFSKDKIILDKSPFNFFWIGFIKIIFPNAKIIHMNRDIKDTAVSIYNNLFGGIKMDWTYSQKNIVKYVQIYKEIMSFWKEKIPNYIYDLNYEDLVNDQENISKQILKFCGLEWDDKCLNFYETAVPVHTVSLHQSRQPIYKKSINSNINYSKYKDFFDELERLK